MSHSLQMAELLRAARSAQRRETELEAPCPLDAATEAAALAPPGVTPPAVWSESPVPAEIRQTAHVALPTASVGDLWGKPLELPRVQAVLDGLLPQQPQQERTRLEKQIEQRVGELDRQWQSCDAAFRGGEVLRMERRLPGEARTALARDTDRLVRVDALRQRLCRKLEEAEAVSRGGEVGRPEGSGRDLGDAERTAAHCRRSLERLERVEERVVRDAERVVDAQGLRLELLTQAESRLEPSAPREKRLGHLLCVWLGVFTGLMQEKQETEREQSKARERVRDDALDEERVRKGLVRRLEQARPSLPTQTSEPLRIIRG